jgi:kynureninase
MKNTFPRNSFSICTEWIKNDPLFRNEFHIPIIDGQQVIYWNSLGLQPKARSYIEED